MRTFLDVSDSDTEDFVSFSHVRRSRKVHSNASRFQVYCSRVLLGLCRTSPRLKQSVIEAGGREVVLAAIEKFPRSFDVSAMADLLEDQQENKAQVKGVPEESPDNKEAKLGVSDKQRFMNNLKPYDDVKTGNVTFYF